MISVVLIEDEEYLRREIALMTPWQELGCTLIGEAENGLEGLELIRKISPQLIITDIRMPGMDGLAMLKELDRTMGRTKPSAILLTGHSDFEYARTAMRLGVQDYLLKPIDDDEFHKLIKKIAADIAVRTEQEQIRYNAELIESSHLSRFREYGMQAGGDSKDEYIRLSVAYIRDNFHKDIGLPDVAEQLGITQSYLSRLFKEKTSYTFLEYLTCYRLRKALQLLHNRSLKINEIAHQTGFRDHGYFTQLFRRYIGVTPGQFRTGSTGERN